MWGILFKVTAPVTMESTDELSVDISDALSERDKVFTSHEKHW